MVLSFLLYLETVLLRFLAAKYKDQDDDQYDDCNTNCDHACHVGRGAVYRQYLFFVEMM